MIIKNMSSRDFKFDKTGMLRHIGASFYATYLYSLNIDDNEKRWISVSTKWRLKHIPQTKKYVRKWLNEILKMRNLHRNRMGISANEIKKFAQNLLDLKIISKFQ